MDAAGSLRSLIRAYALIVVAVVAAALVVTRAVDHRLGRDVTTYSAAARVQMDSPQPKSLPEATALGDTARAVVTSPNHVAAALRAVGAPRDVEDFAQNHVSVQPLGSSQVVQITVTDPVPAVASGVANALANDLVTTREQAASAETAKVLGGLDAQIAAIQQQIGQVNAQLANVNNTVDVSTPGGRQQLADATATLRTQLDTLTRNLVALQGERDSIQLAAAQRPKATVVEPASVPTQADFPRRYLDDVLGVLAGLVLAVLLAAVLELVRPTVRGKTAVARLFGAPILGERTFLRRDRARALAWTAMRLRLAAAAAGVDTVELVAAEIHPDLDAICDELNVALGVEGTAARQAEAASVRATPVDVRPRPAGRIASLAATRSGRAYHGSLVDMVREVSETVAAYDDGNGHSPTADGMAGRSVATAVADASREGAVHSRPPAGSTTSLDGRTLAAPLPYPSLVARPFRPGTAGLGRMGVGLVVVAPTRLRRQSADPVLDLVELTRWPVLGVIFHPRWKPAPIRWTDGVDVSTHDRPGEFSAR